MFDKDKLAKLLVKAQGDRSINEYGRQTGISAAHISRLTRGLLDAPPNPQTLKQLSDWAENGVTYQDLMIASGHLEPEWQPGPAGLDTSRISGTPRHNVSTINDEEAELIAFVRRSWSKLTPEQRRKKLDLAKVSLRIIDEVDKGERKE